MRFDCNTQNGRKKSKMEKVFSKFIIAYEKSPSTVHSFFMRYLFIRFVSFCFSLFFSIKSLIGWTQLKRMTREAGNFRFQFDWHNIELLEQRFSNKFYDIIIDDCWLFVCVTTLFSLWIRKKLVWKILRNSFPKSVIFYQNLVWWVQTRLFLRIPTGNLDRSEFSIQYGIDRHK